MPGGEIILREASLGSAFPIDPAYLDNDRDLVNDHSEMTEPHVGDPLVRLHVERAGTGAPIVLSHGLGDDASTWAPLVPHLDRAHSVVTWDLPGHRFSDAPRNGYSARGAIADLLGAELGCVHVRVDGETTARSAAETVGTPLRLLVGETVDALLRAGEEREAELRDATLRAGVEIHEVSTGDDLVDALVRIVEARKRRRR